ncbi:MAG: hypothetical protein EG823_02075 [Actinobacteria bacterium]|nr:hypothetical protein [Actinomycetota bacterium]
MALEEQADLRPSRSRLILRRVLVGVAVTAIVLVALGATLYFFGGMWVRTPEVFLAYEELVESGSAPPVEGRFVVPIPGCVCHSDDPVLQAQHSARRIRECSKCHERVGPQGRGIRRAASQ